jgi:hypothetical protein
MLLANSREKKKRLLKSNRGASCYIGDFRYRINERISVSELFLFLIRQQHLLLLRPQLLKCHRVHGLRGEANERQVLKNTGFQKHLAKPVDPTELVGANGEFGQNRTLSLKPFLR